MTNNLGSSVFENEPGSSGNSAVARLSLTEMAARIQRHLNRFAADPAIAQRLWIDKSGEQRTTVLFWHPSARRGGSRVMVRYVNYQYTSSLTRDEAMTYLTWLDAGNIGSHYRLKTVPSTEPVNLSSGSNTDESIKS